MPEWCLGVESKGVCAIMCGSTSISSPASCMAFRLKAHEARRLHVMSCHDASVVQLSEQLGVQI